jgi:hypothetical protein
MKPFLILIGAIFTLGLLFTSPGCDLFTTPPEEGTEQPADVSAQGFETPRAVILQDGKDTLTNADTLDLDLGTFNSPITYQIQVSADSVSGSTAGNMYLELDSDGDGANFYRLETMTINGVTSRLYETGTIVGGTLRLRYIQGGTQVNHLWQEFYYSARAPN